MLKKGILLSFAASGALFADGGMTEQNKSPYLRLQKQKKP